MPVFCSHLLFSPAGHSCIQQTYSTLVTCIVRVNHCRMVASLHPRIEERSRWTLEDGSLHVITPGVIFTSVFNRVEAIWFALTEISCVGQTQVKQIKGW